MEERRAHRRYATRRTVEIDIGARKILGVTENVSRGGALVRADVSRIGVGEQVRVTFPSLGDASAHAEVRWLGPGTPARIGVAFKTRLRRPE